MIFLIATAAVVLWFSLGYIAAARDFAYFQGEFPESAKAKKNKDKHDACILFLGGLPAFISAFGTTFHWGNYGFDWLWPIR